MRHSAIVCVILLYSTCTLLSLQSFHAVAARSSSSNTNPAAFSWWRRKRLISTSARAPASASAGTGTRNPKKNACRDILCTTRTASSSDDHGTNAGNGDDHSQNFNRSRLSFARIGDGWHDRDHVPNSSSSQININHTTSSGTSRYGNTNTYLNRKRNWNRNMALQQVRTKDSDVEIEMKTEIEETETIQVLSECTSSISTKSAKEATQEKELSTSTSEDQNHNTTKSKKTITLRTFHYPPANVTLHGLSVSLPQFRSWIQYNLQERMDNTLESDSGATRNANTDTDMNMNAIEEFGDLSSREVHASDPQVRKTLRKLWFARELICERTEVLAVYPNDSEGEGKSTNRNRNQDHDEEEDGKKPVENSNKGHTSDVEENENGSSSTKRVKKKKRGGFQDLLEVYCDRLVGIKQDELNDQHPSELRVLSSEEEPNAKSISYSNQNKEPAFHMQTWLEQTYGKRRTDKLLIHNFNQLPSLDRQKNVFLHLLHWFKENYPYYYDQCGQCGASYRDDSSSQNEIDENDAEIGGDVQGGVDVGEGMDADVQNQNTDHGTDNDNNHDNHKDDKDIDADKTNENENETLQGSFIGYCYPDQNELLGRAARTELYQCHSCGTYTRFPRYNNAKQIVENGGRGRCGEYSILLYRILRSLGHEARWVVDWADHVWAEVWWDGRWVHLDPCEAALDHPLLYEEWGKKQTYIVAFWMPLNQKLLKWNDSKQFGGIVGGEGSDVLVDHASTSGTSTSETPADYPAAFECIQDVTKDYTSDTDEEILNRRGGGGENADNSDEIIGVAKQKLLSRFGFGC